MTNGRPDWVTSPNLCVAVDQGVIICLDASVPLVARVLRLECILADFMGDMKCMRMTGMFIRAKIDEMQTALVANRRD